MPNYIRDPHTATFVSQPGCGKTHLVLELIEKEYNKHFDYTSLSVPRSKKIMPRSGSKITQHLACRSNRQYLSMD